MAGPGGGGVVPILSVTHTRTIVVMAPGYKYTHNIFINYTPHEATAFEHT